MPKPSIKDWISAMRLRTLPLALASTITGTAMALQDGVFSASIFIMTGLTTILLQINSNLANDYGDFEHGTDNEDRVGPQRALQGGGISVAQMRKAIAIASGLALISGLGLLYITDISLVSKAVLLVLGIAAIYASLKYTAGSNPYGYRGLGDVSVMSFFGLLGVVGAYYCQIGSMSWLSLLPAIAIGAFSAGVLNVNNTRDLEADQKAGKITLAVRLGPEAARKYHLILLLLGWISLLVFAFLQFESIGSWMFVLSAPLFIINGWKVYTIKEPKKLDPFLKQLALSTFLLSILMIVGAFL